MTIDEYLDERERLFYLLMDARNRGDIEMEYFYEDEFEKLEQKGIIR